MFMSSSWHVTVQVFPCLVAESDDPPCAAERASIVAILVMYSVVYLCSVYIIWARK